MTVTVDADHREHDRGPRPRLPRARRRLRDDLAVVERGARLVQRRLRGDGRARRGPDPLPHARAARHAVRARLLPLPREGPLFVVREHHRHRAGHSYNEWSGRYSKIEAEFYVPDYVRTQVGKPGAYSFEPVEPDVRRRGARGDRRRRPSRRSRPTSGCSSRASRKEVARTVLPLATYTKYFWSCNPRSLMHFCSLRNSEHAQFEIRRVRARRRELPRAAHAGHARRLRGKRPHGAVNRPRPLE